MSSPTSELSEREQREKVERHARLENMHALIQAILRNDSRDVIANIAVRNARQLIPDSSGSIVLLFDDEVRQSVVLAADHDLGQRNDFTQGTIFPVKALSYKKTKVAKSIIVPDLRRVRAPAPIEKTLLDLGIRACAQIPILNHVRDFGVAILFSDQVNVFGPEQMQIAEGIANSLSIAFNQAHLHGEVEAGWDRLHRLSERLVEVQENERRYIARELHDEIGQALTGLKITLEMYKESSQVDDHQDLQFAQELITDLISRVQQLSLDLRPGMLDDLGLLPTLMWYLDRFTAQTDVDVIFQHQDLQRRFPQEIETAAYRIIQEALTNVARHANVDEAKVQLVCENEILAILVEDHGRGFLTGKALAADESVGLMGMRERAMILGGELKIISIPESGTQVLAKFPLTGQHIVRDKKDE